jgi:beta propeller repeat protein
VQVIKIGEGLDPAIYDSKVTWSDNSGSIHLYNIITKKDTKISSASANYPAIYENKLVWRDEISGTPRLTVYDISSGTSSYITKNVDDTSIPAIYGNRILWSANYNSSNYNYNVYMQDISTSKQTRIAAGNSPDIYDSKVTYGYEDDEGRNIIVYDINTKKAINIQSGSQLFNPHIYGNKVIWSNLYTRLGFIQMYDLVTEKTIDVTNDNTFSGDPDNPDAGADTGTHARINEDKIVYSKSSNDRFGNAGVYIYDISSAKSTLIYKYPEQVYTTPDIYGNTVVWGIDSSLSNTNDTGIYLSTLKSRSNGLQCK